MNRTDFLETLESVKDNPQGMMTLLFDALKSFVDAHLTLDADRVERTSSGIRTILKWFEDNKSSAREIPVDFGPTAILDPDTLHERFIAAEALDNVRITWVLMSSRRYFDLRRFGRDAILLEQESPLTRLGLQGFCLGANILTYGKLSSEELFLIGEGPDLENHLYRFVSKTTP